jgi:hypothetical protein
MDSLPLPPEFREVATRHHEFPIGAFRLLHFVRISDRMADALGFPVLTLREQPSFEQAFGELPEPVRLRMLPDPDGLRAEVILRIEAWS